MDRAEEENLAQANDGIARAEEILARLPAAAARDLYGVSPDQIDGDNGKP